MNEQHYVPDMQGCSDGGCIFNYKPPGTMVTNGGCSCERELMRSEAGQKAYRTILWMRANWQYPAFAGEAVDNSGHTWAPLPVNPFRAVARTMLHKVNMIKEIRDRTGGGLKVCKDAMDYVYASCSTFDDVVEKAVSHITGEQGYCVMGDNCLCGGDTPRVRMDCFEWKAL